jgi:hypothetical protein
MLRFFILLIRGLIAVRWSACLKIRARSGPPGCNHLLCNSCHLDAGGNAQGSLSCQPHSGDFGARPVTRSVSALLTCSSRRRVNGFSGVSQYRVEDGPPPLLRSRPKVPVDYSLVDGLSLVAGFHTSWSLCARAGLVASRQTFVHRRHRWPGYEAPIGGAAPSPLGRAGGER